MFKVYIERGTKRTFAGALDWPGWSRGAGDEVSALQALLDYGPRYADALRGSGVAFKPPATLADLKVVERLKGGTGTDYGAPEAHPAGDERKMDAVELKRSAALLKTCWAAFDHIARAARGKTLRGGPRGGGRTLEKMIEHVRGAEEAYIERLGWWKFAGEADPTERGMAEVREAAITGIQASAAGIIPALGPRGGKRWPPRYFVRRLAWHVLDHAWEIEDRLA
jgi:hypothetical protein